MAEELGLNVKILKLGMTNPIPRAMCGKFIKSCSSLVVVEELEPFLENQFKVLAFDVGADVKIYGKSTGHFSRLYEYTPDIVVDAFSKIFKVNNPFPKPIQSVLKAPRRPPSLCPGVRIEPRIMQWRKQHKKHDLSTDIGCYTLGKEPPLEMADVLLCMGSNAGMACGFSVCNRSEKSFRSWEIPPSSIQVFHRLWMRRINNHDVVITVLDNRTTAMTGHQPHPGTPFDGMGRPAKTHQSRGCRERLWYRTYWDCWS